MIKRKIKELLPGIFCRSDLLANLYYCLFSSAFSREHRAVLAGKSSYLEKTKKQKANYFMLVRNTHRIEKGLLMQPRRPRFATGYLAETISSFENIWDSQACVSGSDEQQKWFRDVLDEYFDAVTPSALILRQKERYKAVVNGHSIRTAEERSVPYCRGSVDLSAISYEEFLRLTRQRRSVRWFLQKPVPRELIDKALLAARQSPSACNRQPYEFRIFDDAEVVKELAALPMGTAGYAHSVPVFVVIVGSLDAYISERDRHLIYIDGALAGMTFMLALETLGLASCPINWPDIEERERKMQDFLGLDVSQRPVMCIALGYPDPEGKVAYSGKRNLSYFRSYNSRG